MHSPGTLQHWVDRIRAGDVRALARAISTIEDNRPESRELLKALFNFDRPRPLIGLTGAPGTGKSTLVDQLAATIAPGERRSALLPLIPPALTPEARFWVIASA